MELSGDYMPGLGGRGAGSKSNAVETAAAVNQINPDFIRLRTLAIPPNTPLYADFGPQGRFEKATDVDGGPGAAPVSGIAVRASPAPSGATTS